MKIYYKQNTGLKTAQDEKTDYFTIDFIGAKMSINRAEATILFWEKLEHAQSNKPANLSRTVAWDITKETSIEAGLNTLLSSDSLDSTVGDSFTLKGATEV